MTAQNLAEEHARQNDIVGELRLPRALRARVNFAERFSDDVEIIGIVVNEKGAQRAIATDAVRTLGFPYSVSPTFLNNNQHQTLEDAIDEMEKIKNKGEEAGLDTVVYISMAFGNPYGDPWNVGEVVDAVDLLES